MISLFHGDDFSASRRQLLHVLQSLSVQPVKLEAETLTPPTLTQVLTSSSLFAADQPIVIERLWSLAAPQRQQLLNIVIDNPHRKIFLWENQTLTSQQLKAFSKIKLAAKLFPLPKTIFSFLDSFRSDQPQASLKWFRQCLKQQPVSLIFYLLGRRVSQLIQSKIDPTSLTLPGWQKAKLQSQARLFTLQQLLSLHRRLLTIDIKIKTGQTDLDLTTWLELFLIKP